MKEKQNQWKVCKITQKAHEFELVVPPHISLIRKSDITADEFYKKDDIEREKRKQDPRKFFVGSRIRHWQCIHCKKKGFDTEEKPEAIFRANYTPNK